MPPAAAAAARLAAPEEDPEADGLEEEDRDILEGMALAIREVLDRGALTGEAAGPPRTRRAHAGRAAALCAGLV